MLDVPAMDHADKLLAAADRLTRALRKLRFAAPVSHVYNPLEYARAPYADYVQRYAQGEKRVLFLGMNPGPYGMTQTGVPFGEVAHVRDWLGVRGEVGRPKHEHPKRVVSGFACPRSEVSGARLWGLWRSTYGEPQNFFRWAFVANYCPLVFMEASGRNLTPDKLPPGERERLLVPCDAHLREVVDVLAPSWIVGVGKFAEGRARTALVSPEYRLLKLASMPHPSPASPAANRNWAELALAALDAQGVPRDPPAPRA
jgi:single-strand selective monofunctional uracil DNA glycosylase